MGGRHGGGCSQGVLISQSPIPMLIPRQVRWSQAAIPIQAWARHAVRTGLAKMGAESGLAVTTCAVGSHLPVDKSGHLGFDLGRSPGASQPATCQALSEA